MPRRPLSDDDHLTQLIRQIAAGDRRALNALYEAVSGRLYWLLLLVFDEDNAERRLEESFVRIWCEAADFDEDRHGAWQWIVAVTFRPLPSQLH